MAFGNPTRYIQVRSNHLQRTRTQVERRQMYLLFRMQLDPAKVKNIPAGMTAVEAWDAAVDEANRTYCKRMHNLFCDNCHSHVCRALQTMEYSVGVLVVAFLPTQPLVHKAENIHGYCRATAIYLVLCLLTLTTAPHVRMTGLEALQHGHARCRVLFHWEAGFSWAHGLHLRTVCDYPRLLVACPALMCTVQWHHELQKHVPYDTISRPA